MTEEITFDLVERRTSKLRVAATGPTGTGKTAFAILLALIFGEKIAVMDSERGSVAKSFAAYTKDKKPRVRVKVLNEKTPLEYIAVLEAAAAAGFECVVIDSFSHSWMGALEKVDKMGGQKFTNGWKVVSPEVTRLVDAILNYPGHVICTMRTKSDYALETNDKGKVVPRKIGLAPVARDGTDYEFDVMFDMNTDGSITVSKSRCPELNGRTFTRPMNPGDTDQVDEIPLIGSILKAWLEEGGPVASVTEGCDRMKHATTMAMLKAVLPWIEAEKVAGRLTESDLPVLRDEYKTRAARLQAEAQADADVPE